MPTYRYRCPYCNREFNVQRKMEDHDRAPQCCGVSAVRIYVMPFVSAAARPTSAGASALARSKTEERDMNAYARLRKDGVQPRGIDGSAHLERHAGTATEIEMGRVLGDNRKVREGIERSKELGYL